MAQTLVSPGVAVSVIDESQYVPAAASSVPFVLIATAQNKVSGDGTGVAPGTLAANANKLFLATSQRALTANYGVPFFYQTSTGTPINGYELNEYGLLAAYSALGATNVCYVLRADIDLAALTASLTRPLGTPNNNEYWLNTTSTQWGIFQWNQTTGAFTNQVPNVITNTAYLNETTEPYPTPLQSYGSIGQYAVVTTNTANPIYYKRGGATTAQIGGGAGNSEAWAALYNTWVLVGSDNWKSSWATVQGSNTPTELTAGNTFTINTETITVPVSPNNTVTGVVDAINTLEIPGVYAANIGGALSIFINSTSQSNGSTADGQIAIGTGTGTPLTTLGITAGTYNAPQFQASPNYTVPQWNTFSTSPAGGAPTGSVWSKTTNVNSGMNLVVEKYNSTLGTWVTQSCPVFSSEAVAINTLDPTGGKLIPAGSTYARFDQTNDGTASFTIYERYTTGPTIVTGTTINPTFTINDTFGISASEPGSNSYTNRTDGLATLLGTTAADFVTAVSRAAVPNVSASIDSNGSIVFTHATGGDILLYTSTDSPYDYVGTPVADAGFTVQESLTIGTPLVRPFYANGTQIGVALTNWVGSPLFTYTPSATGPDQDPTDGTYWYYSDPTQVDIMIQSSGSWVGYQTVDSDARGYDLGNTNPTGPIISATTPTTQTDSTPLVYGDLWVNTSDLENYPLIYRWQNVNGEDQWVQLDNSDGTQPSGIIFADARWAPNGTTDPVADPLPSIESLLTSNYLDPDAPNADLYPNGILLFNTRRSGFNVKTYQANYFNATSFPADAWSSTTTYQIGQYVTYSGNTYACIQGGSNQNPSTATAYWSEQTVTNTWLSASGLKNDGSPYMGRQAQRAIIVEALKAAIDTNTSIREEQNSFQLIACPQYPELAINMAALNNERNNTAFVVVDTPLRLTPDEVVTWSSNNNGAGLSTGDGLNTNNSYAGTFYPSCQTTDLSGQLVVTAPSHMMLRTIIRSDSVAYPWLAPAGTRRGIVDNATLIGYVDAQTGEFQTLSVGQGLRDVLYTHQINPITFIPGVGITNFGNKTLQATASALDRINVARLVAFMRGRLETIGKQYLFEPNDAITRNQIKNAIDSLCVDLVAKRGLYDYLVVCDDSNNTPTTIDRNELWVDIAIEPVKAVEFIYIPMRILNTGEIATLGA